MRISDWSSDVCSSDLVLLGDSDVGSDRDQVDVNRRLDGVAGADGLGEVVAGVEEDDDETWRDLGREVGQYGVTHRQGHAKLLAERGHGPLDKVLGKPQSELGASGRHYLAQTPGRE